MKLVGMDTRSHMVSPARGDMSRVLLWLIEGSM